MSLSLRFLLLGGLRKQINSVDCWPSRMTFIVGSSSDARETNCFLTPVAKQHCVCLVLDAKQPKPAVWVIAKKVCRGKVLGGGAMCWG